MHRYGNRQPLERSWRIWDLDAEMRYWPVLDALPSTNLPVCEIGSGTAGIASWTGREIIGIDPGDDDRHGDVSPLPNLRRIHGTGTSVPLPDQYAGATIAVDTVEHVSPAHRRALIEEMIRITAPGGRIIIMGPTGQEAARADRWLLDTVRRRDHGADWSTWLEEHLEFGLPTVGELRSVLDCAPIKSVSCRGYFNLRLWSAMHLAAMGAVPRVGPHAPIWKILGVLGRTVHVGPFYRWRIVAELSGGAATGPVADA